MEKRKAQAALEFMVLFGFFAVVFMLVAVTLVQRQAENAQLKKSEVAKETCLALRDEINEAVAFGNGYWKIAIVKKALIEQYAVRIRNGTIGVLIGEGVSANYYACVVSSNEIVGLPFDAEGMTVDFDKKLKITNREGVIVLEQ